MGIEPTTSRFYSHNLCLCATAGLEHKKIKINNFYISTRELWSPEWESNHNCQYIVWRCTAATLQPLLKRVKLIFHKKLWNQLHMCQIISGQRCKSRITRWHSSLRILNRISVNAHRTYFLSRFDNRRLSIWNLSTKTTSWDYFFSYLLLFLGFFVFYFC